MFSPPRGANRLFYFLLANVGRTAVLHPQESFGYGFLISAKVAEIKACFLRCQRLANSLHIMKRIPNALKTKVVEIFRVDGCEFINTGAHSTTVHAGFRL